MLCKNIENRLKIVCDNVDLTSITKIEFYIKQLNFFKCYDPVIISASEMVVIVPLEDAMKLSIGDVELQFAYTDSHGNPKSTGITRGHVRGLLKGSGYNPI